MVKISKDGQTLIIAQGVNTNSFPCSAVCLHADKGSDSVDVKLKASRKTIISFNYKDMTPTVGSAEEAVEMITNLL